jgi:hypothetical protein
MKNATRLALFLVSLSIIQTSCFGFYGTRSIYGGQGVEVNGATVSMSVKPEGTSSGSYSVSAVVVGVAVANLDGPFRWRIEAEGKEGVHQAMYVQRLRTMTALTKRDEWFPEKWLGDRVAFARKGSYAPGVVKAVFDVPALLDVKPKEDGALEVCADVIIEANGRRERKVVKFRLEPAERKESETIFLHAEIVSSIGKPVSEWEEKGWD